ncbi:AAA family ATPase [Sphingosinicella terrae]|uniref:AAA family ATPase n=1 Tax=Sphingosinicella terrae TaxID=2172047 RepID=UPI000E0DACBC|nr:AAA family ATPase [Sphingosinicella terrae]
MIVKGEAPPRLWIVAGPNGSGKSTLYGRSDVAEFDGSVWIINPDLLTRRLQTSEGLDLVAANLAAVKRIEQWLDASIDVHQTIGVETVLSTSKYRRLVSKAKERGFEVRLIYVYVDTLQRQLERIRLRVAKGGHDVPLDKAASRRGRSFGEFPWFFWMADQAWVFDNSGAEPKLVAGKEGPSAAVLSESLHEQLRGGIRSFVQWDD